jgi:hypothetical protein
MLAGQLRQVTSVVKGGQTLATSRELDQVGDVGANVLHPVLCDSGIWSNSHRSDIRQGEVSVPSSVFAKKRRSRAVEKSLPRLKL